MALNGDYESREPSPFRGSYGDINSLEPMPYNPMPSQGYRSSDYHYHYGSHPYPRADPQISGAQYQYQQPYPQINQGFGYRQPPSPSKRHIHDSNNKNHGYDNREGKESYNPYIYSHNRYAYSDDYGDTNDRAAHPNFYRHEPPSWSERTHQHEQLRWDGEEEIKFDQTFETMKGNCSEKKISEKVGASIKSDQHEPIEWD